MAHYTIDASKIGIAAPSAPTITAPNGISIPVPVAPEPSWVDRANSVIDPVNAALNGFVNGIPIIGPALEGMGDQVNAAGAQVLNAAGVPMDPNALSAGGVAQQRATDRENYPIAYGAGQVAGAVTPFMAAGVAGNAIPGVKAALGMEGPMLQRIGAGLTSGAVIGGLDAHMRGESPEYGAIAGGIGGGASGPVERGVSAVANALLRRSPGAAATTLARGFERDKIDPAQARTMIQQIGPDAVAADLGPNLGRQAAAIASLPGEGQQIVRDALMGRRAAMPSRIKSDVVKALGEASRSPSQIDASIAANMGPGTPLGQAYRQAFRGASAVSQDGLESLALDLDSQIVNTRGDIRSGLEKARGFLNVYGTDHLDPDPRALFQSRQALDDMISRAQAQGADKQAGALGGIRQKVDSLLAQAAPGIKDADAQFQELARQREGLKEGMSALNRDVWPQDIEAAMKPEPASPLFVGPSGKPFTVSQGARAQIEQIIGNSGNDLTAMKQALRSDGSWNRQKLASIFGSEKAGKLEDILDREIAYNRTENTVMGNSETAARQAAQKDVQPWEFGQTPPTVMGLVGKVPMALANWGAKSRSEAVNAQIAAALMGRLDDANMYDRLAAAQAYRKRAGLIPAPGVGVAASQQLQR